MQTNAQQKNYTIKYYSKSDGKRVNRPYNPQRQYEFIAKNWNLIKCYWDEKKGDWRRSIIENIVSIKPIKNKKRKKGKKWEHKPRWKGVFLRRFFSWVRHWNDLSVLTETFNPFLNRKDMVKLVLEPFVII